MPRNLFISFFQVMHEFTELVKKRHCQLSKASCCAMKKVLDQRARLFALNVPEFISLSSNDQMILQEENGGPLIELRIATFFQTDFKARQQLGKNCIEIIAFNYLSTYISSYLN